jgi:hypothetical protein
MPILRLCVVGAGSWSTEMHLPALRTLQRRGAVRFAGVCDADAAKATDYARQLDAETVFTDADAMLARVRADGVILIIPNTASAEEHYTIRTAPRTVFLSFPHRGVHDAPGWVERREGNKVVERLGPADFGFKPDDFPGLTGILGEHETFIRLLQSGRTAASSLAATLQTQEVRERLVAFMRQQGVDACRSCDPKWWGRLAEPAVNPLSVPHQKTTGRRYDWIACQIS